MKCDFYANLFRSLRRASIFAKVVDLSEGEREPFLMLALSSPILRLNSSFVGDVGDIGFLGERLGAKRVAVPSANTTARRMFLIMIYKNSLNTPRL